MVLCVGNTKGGVGKTTLAVNLTIGLAAGGQDVLLIDGDEQATALAFTALRAARGVTDYTAVALHGAPIRSQVRQLTQHYKHIVIDVGGRDSGSLRAALTVSQLLVIPVAPRSFDLWGVEQTAELVREAREVNPELRALAVLNCADFQGQDNDQAQAMLAELPDIGVAGVRLARRKAYCNAAAQGLGILDLQARKDKPNDRQKTQAL
jgi:chromosome partitioning protein